MWTDAKQSLAVTWYQHIYKQSKKFSLSLRCFAYLMPKIQIFGNSWIIDYIFHFSSGFGSQPISANENSQILAVFYIITWEEKSTFSPAFLRQSASWFYFFLFSTFTVFFYSISLPFLISSFYLIFAFTILSHTISTVKLLNSVLFFPIPFCSKKKNEWLHNNWDSQLKPSAQASDGVNGFPIAGRLLTAQLTRPSPQKIQGKGRRDGFWLTSSYVFYYFQLIFNNLFNVISVCKTLMI